MLRNKITIVFILLFCYLLALDDYKHEYIKTVDKKIIKETYELKKAEEEIVRTYYSEGAIYQSFYDSVNTVRFTIRDSVNRLQIEVERNNNKLYLWGLDQDKKIDKIFDIDDDPWYQAMSYSLYSFALSDKEKIRYWFLRTDKFKVYKMQAIKREIETIYLADQAYKAQKVEVKLTGFLSNFWHSYYWFRLKDGLYLKYEGVNGPPGTPLTSINLIK